MFDVQAEQRKNYFYFVPELECKVDARKRNRFSMENIVLRSPRRTISFMPDTYRESFDSHDLPAYDTHGEAFRKQVSRSRCIHVPSCVFSARRDSSVKRIDCTQYGVSDQDYVCRKSGACCFDCTIFHQIPSPCCTQPAMRWSGWDRARCWKENHTGDLSPVTYDPYVDIIRRLLTLRILHVFVFFTSCELEMMFLGLTERSCVKHGVTPIPLITRISIRCELARFCIRHVNLCLWVDMKIPVVNEMIATLWSEVTETKYSELWRTRLCVGSSSKSTIHMRKVMEHAEFHRSYYRSWCDIREFFNDPVSLLRRRLVDQARDIKEIYCHSMSFHLNVVLARALSMCVQKGVGAAQNTWGILPSVHVVLCKSNHWNCNIPDCEWNALFHWVEAIRL